ncbi:helix-turn-helix domain-containing protein [Tahibacter amnicola]|uniref:AraC family transcriptional regulator n=1 Tax=Tahibacter amnicola TaxID=2976241 RepID=A0ABY6BGI6_9GAMM|nr:AraC family transcriptional regulator [Tahibacter amnicola]UXI69139.1 AraC family transcriptional regulator [Tahibacter amnicola]
MRRPHPALRQHVTQFWYGEGRVAYQRDRILPRTQSYLLVNLGPPQFLVLPGPPEIRIVFDDFWFSGLYEGPIDTEAPEGSALLGVAFSATGAASLLPWSQAALANRTEPLEAIIGVSARQLRERLLHTPDTTARFDLVENWLLDVGMTGRSVHPLVHWAMQRIAEAGGNLRTQELAQQSGYSRKHLTGVISREVGLPPKALMRLQRFGATLQALGRGHPDTWADLANRCGYFDQSHFINEFQQYAGTTPAEFLRLSQPDPGSVVVR